MNHVDRRTARASRRGRPAVGRRIASARRLFALLVAASALAATIVPAVLAATPNQIAPGQRVDAKVLLISADGTEPGFGAWKAELAREGVPYDSFVAYNGAAKAATLTDDTLADYANNHARYSAVILATGDLGHNITNADATISFLSALSDPEWAALAKFERTFGIRQLSDYTAPTPAHGLNTVGGATQDGVVGNADRAPARPHSPTSRDRCRSPTTTRPSAEAFGYQATPGRTRRTGRPWSPGRTTPLTSGSTRIPTTAARRWSMTVASNENQSQAQLLRHGDAQLGHARGLPGLPAQLPRAADRRSLPRRRRLGPGDPHHQLRRRRPRAG